MEVEVFILQFLTILVAARVMGEIATTFGAPSVIGELVAGIIIGPSLLGWVEANEVIHILAEIGVILLLFEIGLETDVGKLLNAGGKAVTVAIGGFVAPLSSASPSHTSCSTSRFWFLCSSAGHLLRRASALPCARW